jgi:aspartate/methionine/tyrosine aminotransferase
VAAWAPPACSKSPDRHIGINPETLYRLLAEKYMTFAVPGRCFGMDNRYFRLGFGSKYEEIVQGLANLDLCREEPGE